MFNSKCNVCGTVNDKRYQGTPYWMCSNCDLWYQDPLPPKLYEAPREKGEDGRSAGHLQSKNDLEQAAHLARCFAHNWISKIPRIDRPYLKALDIGCKYPYFAHILRKEFGIDAYGIDGLDQDSPDKSSILTSYSEELDVPMFQLDFEEADVDDLLTKTKYPKNTFDAISLIHVFEHFYKPLLALDQIQEAVSLLGYVLIRLPSHDVWGFECHLSEGHYKIHPYFYSKKSFEHLLSYQSSFKIMETYPIGAGTRDFILQRIT